MWYTMCKAPPTIVLTRPSTSITVDSSAMLWISPLLGLVIQRSKLYAWENCPCWLSSWPIQRRGLGARSDCGAYSKRPILLGDCFDRSDPARHLHNHR